MKLIQVVSIVIVCLLLLTSQSIARDNFEISVLITGDWGENETEFGREFNGKTEDGYALDFVVSKDKIFILDAINNRVKVYSLAGELVDMIKLKIDWQKYGLPQYFTLYKDYLYLLISKPPQFNPVGIREIHKFSIDGGLQKSFGSKYIPKNAEEYFDRIVSRANDGHLYIGLGGVKTLSFDSEGVLLDVVITSKKGEVIDLVGITQQGFLVVTSSRSSGDIINTLVIDPIKNQSIKSVKGRYPMSDGKSSFASVHTLDASKRKKRPMQTIIEMFNSNDNSTKKFELTGDIKNKNPFKEKVYKYKGKFSEVSKMDTDGNIYHLIALDDGVVLRKIILK
jgi:hypothetical protein